MALKKIGSPEKIKEVTKPVKKEKKADKCECGTCSCGSCMKPTKK